LAVSVVLLGGLAFSSFGLLGMKGTELELSFTKRPAAEMAVARVTTALAEGETVLAAESISAWIPTLPQAPPLVYVRQIYLDQSLTVVDPSELNRRRLLARWVNDVEGGPDTGAVLSALAVQCPRIVVFREDRKPGAFDLIMEQFNARMEDRVEGYQIWRLTARCP